VAHGTRNRLIIYAATFVRSLATALIGVLVGIYLARLDLSKTAIGIIITAGLAGGAGAALLATIAADGFGRRRFLVLLTLLSAAGGFAVGFISNEALLAAAAFLGMVNGMGRDRGAALAVEQAILPSTAPDDRRTSIFAFYSVLQSVGAALGALAAGIPNLISRFGGVSETPAMRIAIIVYAILMAATAFAYLGLTEEVEVYAASPGFRVSRETRDVLIKLSALFSLDSLGGGFLTQALISLFFVERFAVSAATVGLLYFGASIANAVSQLIAPILARRIGLINTMVFTHLPSSFLLMLVAIAPDFSIAAALFLAREALVQMDVPARNSYVMAVVRPEERTFASGVTGLVRLGGWAVAPGFAGLFMQGVSIATPLFIGPGMKIIYDLMLYRSFRHLKAPEERAREDAAAASAQPRAR
jgi:MFS family permease